MAARPCGTCSRKVYPNEKISIGSELVMTWYHKSCLVCKECGTTLSMTSISSQAGMIYCAKHVPKHKHSVVLDSMSLKRAKNAPKIQVMGLLKTKVGVATFKGLTLRAKAIAGPVGANRPARGQLGVQRGIISDIDPNVRPVNRIDEEDETEAVSDIDKELAALRDRLDKLKEGVDEEDDDMDFDITEDEANILAEHFNLPPATIKLEAQRLSSYSSKREAGGSLTALFVPPGSTVKRTYTTQKSEWTEQQENLPLESEAALSPLSPEDTVNSIPSEASHELDDSSITTPHVKENRLALVSNELDVTANDTSDEGGVAKSLDVPKPDHMSTLRSLKGKCTVTSEEPSYAKALPIHRFSPVVSMHENKASLTPSSLSFGHGRKPTPHPSDDGSSSMAPATIQAGSVKGNLMFTEEKLNTIVAA